MKKKIEELTREFLNERLKDPTYQRHYREEQMRSYVGKAIAALRKKKKLSPEEFAKKIGVKTEALNRMEKGEYGRYTLKSLIEIAQATDAYLHIDFTSEP
ncbi:MAG TPA: helix-turn-helix transcriptional regulator [Acidobacteriota bacterium]|jgi:DNA-binding XRE family transcriptional regulator